MLFRSSLAAVLMGGAVLLASGDAKANDRLDSKAPAYGSRATPLVYHGGDSFTLEEVRRPWRYRAYRPYSRSYYYRPYYGYRYGYGYRPYYNAYRYYGRPYYWY